MKEEVNIDWFRRTECLGLSHLSVSVKGGDLHDVVTHLGVLADLPRDGGVGEARGVDVADHVDQHRHVHRGGSGRGSPVHCPDVQLKPSDNAVSDSTRYMPSDNVVSDSTLYMHWMWSAETVSQRGRSFYSGHTGCVSLSTARMVS